MVLVRTFGERVFWLPVTAARVLMADKVMPYYSTIQETVVRSEAQAAPRQRETR